MQEKMVIKIQPLPTTIMHVIGSQLIWMCRCECVHLWTSVASLWGNKALHDGPLAASSPWPRRWASGSPGSPSPHPETRSHRGGSRGWREAAGYAQEPLRDKLKKRNLMNLSVQYQDRRTENPRHSCPYRLFTFLLGVCMLNEKIEPGAD